MSRRITLLMIAMVMAALFSSFAAAEEHPEYTAVTRMTMDYFSTVSSLTIYDDFTQPGRKEFFEQTWNEVLGLLAEIDAALSVSDPQSDASRFNALAYGERICASPHTLEVLNEARTVYELTGGAYDPTVSQLVDLYGFSPRFTARKHDTPGLPYDRECNPIGYGFPPPDEAYIAAFQSLVSLPTIETVDSFIVKHKLPVLIGENTYQQTIDLGGIGKGYAVDRVIALLRSRGYAYGSFSCGGSSVGLLQRATASRGANAPAQWGVAIAKPRYGTQDDQVLMRTFMRDVMLSTSGDYEHTYKNDGVRYCHLINPATGWPINMPHDGIQSGICSVTVFGKSAALCDALSTAICVMGLQDALELINAPEFADYDFVLVLYSDAEQFCEIVTNLSASEYELLDEERYRIACSKESDAITYTGHLIQSD